MTGGVGVRGYTAKDSGVVPDHPTGRCRRFGHTRVRLIYFLWSSVTENTTMITHSGSEGLGKVYFGLVD